MFSFDVFFLMADIISLTLNILYSVHSDLSQTSAPQLFAYQVHLEKEHTKKAPPITFYNVLETTYYLLCYMIISIVIFFHI